MCADTLHVVFTYAQDVMLIFTSAAVSGCNNIAKLSRVHNVLFSIVTVGSRVDFYSFATEHVRLAKEMCKRKRERLLID